MAFSWLYNPLPFWPVGAMADLDLAKEWEGCTTIRRRFQNQKEWLQFPVNAVDLDPEEPICGEDGELIPVRPISTKSLELNIEAVLIMLDHYHGNFIDIAALRSQASYCPIKMLNSVPIMCQHITV